MSNNQNTNPKLTLSMIVKNEEKYLKECLESVNGLVDEIVIVDTGSSDNTVKIAEQFGAKIYHFDWIDDFSAARNFALSKSNGKWVLYLDADERINPASKGEIRKIILQNKKSAVNCRIVSKIGSSSDNVIRYTRLFSNSNGLKFSGKLHEQLNDSLLQNNYAIVDSDIEIIHLGYDLSEDGKNIKVQRNIDYLLKEIKDNPNAYAFFKLAQSYSIINDRLNASKYYELVCQSMKAQVLFRAYSFYMLAVYKYEVGLIDASLEYCEKSIGIDNSLPYVHYLAAWCYYRCDQHEKSIIACNNAVLNNRKKKQRLFEINVNETDIFILGIKASLKILNAESFVKFYNELKKSKSIPESNLSSYTGIYKLLTNTLELSEIDLFNSVDGDDLIPLITIVSANNSAQLKLNILARLDSLYANNLYVKEILGKSLCDAGEYKAGINVFEKILFLDKTKPQVYFYLISAHIKNGSPEKIIPLIKEMELQYSGNQQITGKLEMLKNSLKSLNVL